MFRATRPSPLILLSALILATLGAAPLWHTPYLDGGAWWQARIPVDLTNPDDRESIGAFVALRIGKASGELPLVGKEARAIRLVSDTGVEYVFKIQDAAGTQQFESPLASGSALLLPAEVAAAKTERYYVYYDNPKAWRVPDMFQINTADLRSNGFESAGPWNLGKARLSTERAASGKSCVKLVAEGENVAGITSPLIALPKDPKAIIRVSFSVDLEYKSGIAFLLLRYLDKSGAPIATVRRESHLELLTLKESLGGWQRKTFTVGREGSDAQVKLPANAENIVFNMNFWSPSGDNRGTLWLDDLTFDGISAPGGRVTARLGVPETMMLSAPKAEPAFAPGFAWRVPLEVRNLDLEPRERALGSLPLSRLRYQYGLDLDPRSVRLEDEAGKPVPLTLMENEAIFPARVGARSLARYYAYFGGQGAPSPQVPWESILKSDLNLVKNGDFETGAALPDGWMGAVETANVGGAISYGADSTVKYERVSDSRFGKSAIRMIVPPNAAPGWYGWRQMVPGVRPNATYVYGAYVKAEKLTGDFRLYGHFKDAAGKTISTFATPPLGSMGTQDQASTVEGGRWLSLSTTIVTPGGTAAIEIHLTMNTKGVVWHDGVVLAESVAVEGGAAESAKGKGAGFSCWAVNNLLKVFPETVPASEAKELSAGLARAEKEPIQFAMRSPVAIREVKVSLSPLANGSARLGATVHRVGYVPVDFPVGYPQAAIGSPVKRVILQDRSTDGWTGWWPDPLLPAKPFTLEADRSEAFLLIIDSPAQATPGTYKATLTLEGDGRTLRTLPVSVTVWNFTLPERPSISLQFEMGQGPRKFDMPASAKLSNEALWRFMAERRASPGAITPEPVFKMEGGSVSVDFTAYDRSASYCFDTLKMRTSYLPNIFYGFGWGYSPRKFLGFAPFTPEYNAAYKEALKKFMDHARAKGWGERYVLYLSDEPHYEKKDVRDQVIDQMKKLCALIKSVEPGLSVYSSTWGYCHEWDGTLNHWGAGFYGCFPVADLARRKAAGDRFWWTTDGVFCTDTPTLAIERLHPWFAFKYGVDGIEYWGIQWNTYDPFRFGWHSWIPQAMKDGEAPRAQRYPNGDGYYVYPGFLVGEPGYLSTARLEALRDGMEDYEYLKLLEQRIATAGAKNTTAAKKLLDEARSLAEIPNAGVRGSSKITPKETGVLDRLRREMAQAIVALGN